MGREVGGFSGWGTHVNPWLIHDTFNFNELMFCLDASFICYVFQIDKNFLS